MTSYSCPSSFLSYRRRRGTKSVVFKAPSIGRQVYGFFEKIAERPCSFEDLFTTALLARAMLRLRALPPEGRSLETAMGTYDLPLFFHLSNFKAGYINEKDLSQAGIGAKKLRRRILFKVRQAEHLGLVKSRSDALTYAGLLSAAAGERVRLDPELCRRSGAELKQFIKVRRHKEETFPGYRLVRYYSICRQQFPLVDPDIVQRELRSGNYPELVSEMDYCGVTAEQITGQLACGRLRNLVELESFCAGLRILREHYPNTTATLAKTLDSTGSAGTFALIERQNDSRLPRIALCVGYQGENHVGAGFRHLIHQRMEDGSLQAFRQAGESENALLGRFLEDAVFHVAGTARAVVPSRMYPETHMLLSGAIKGNAGHYLTLVLAQAHDPMDYGARKLQVVTALYHSSAKALRACLKRELKGWVELELQKRTDSALNDYAAEFEAVLKEVNALLRKANQASIQYAEVCAEKLLKKRGDVSMLTLDEVDMAEAQRAPVRARALGSMRFGAAAAAGAPARGGKIAAAAPAAAAAVTVTKSLAAIEEEMPDYELAGGGLIFQPQLTELLR